MKTINTKELHSIFNEMLNDNNLAYNSLYEKYYKLVYSIAFSMLKNKQDSEDIAQKVFIKIWKIKKEKLPTKYEASWLYSVTKNETLNFIKNNKEELNINDLYYISQDDIEITNIIEEESFNKIIKNLTLQEQEIVSLKILSNLSFVEISNILNIPVGTIKWKYYKSINNIKASLGKLGIILISFIITLKLILKNNRNMINYETEKNEIKTIENETKIDETEKIDVCNEASNNYLEENQIYENVVKEQTYICEQNCYNIKKVASITLFITLIIILIIFFIKYQLKSLKKMSK